MEAPTVPNKIVKNELDTALFSKDKKFDLGELAEIQNDMDDQSTVKDVDEFDNTNFDMLV